MSCVQCGGVIRTADPVIVGCSNRLERSVRAESGDGEEGIGRELFMTLVDMITLLMFLKKAT